MTIRHDRFLVSLGTALLSLAVMQAATAAPYQLPLLGTAPVAPNVVFTLDDSGSMLGPLMPDSLTSVNPNDNNNPVVPTLSPEENITAYTNFGVVPTRKPRRAEAAEYLQDARRRSHQVNTIYYDPEIRYEPWTQANGTLMAYPTPASTSNWTAVPQSPGSAATTNFTPRVLGSTTRWCLQIGNCSPNTSNVSPAQETNARDDYDPTVYYVLNSATSPTRAGTRRISIWNMIEYARSTDSADAEQTITVFTRGAARTDCGAGSNGARSCSRAQELQNFATWFVYHRTRLLLAKASVAKAFASPDVTGFRLGWGALNNPATTIDGTANTSTLRQGVRNFTTSHKDAFYSWLFGTAAAGGTPLRRSMDDVGRYFSREDANGPWADQPGGGVSQSVASFASCRRSFHILTTDGYWSGGSDFDANTAAARADVEAANGPNITGPNGRTYQYNAAAAENRRYRDGVSNVLADVGMYYWYRDIAPNMDNKIVPTNNNPAFWQHMVNYTVGLGTAGRLNNPGDLAAIEAGTLGWQLPNTTSTNISDPSKADDLWHAAYNSRGQNLSAANSDQFATALQAILSDIASESNKTAGVAVSGASLSVAGLAKYVPEYTAKDWTGELSKFSVSSTGVTTLAPTWTASQQIPSPTLRKIFVGTNGGRGAIDFNYTSMNTAGLTTLMGSTPAVNDALIRYLRGDRSNEGTAAGTYRARGGVLGDIVNSLPLFAGSGLDYQYDSVPEVGSSYATFLSNLESRGKLIYVGANDGMLHAFDDATGAEVFAYVPNAMLPTISRLSDQNYGHRFYVDGPSVEAHARFGSTWKSVLVGTFGAGGKGLFAIDITSPNVIRGSGAGSAVLWELNPVTAQALTPGALGTAAAQDIGYQFSEPDIGPIQYGNGYKWVALVGNGLESANGIAKLLVIDLETGAVLKSLTTATGSAAQPNGLGAVRALRDTQGVIIAAYGGDIQGNVWRFNLSAGESSWNVAFGGAPFYIAKDQSGATQPITAAPAVIPHPLGGTMVVVGTGRLAYDSDRPGVSAQASQVQRLYGLWDKRGGRSVTYNNESTLRGTSNLVRQTINTSALSTDSDGRTYYQISDNIPTWSTQRGWYLDLTLGVGQRVIYPMITISGKVLFNSVVPTPSTACSIGSSFSGILNALTGSLAGQAVLDTNGDGLVNSSDSNASIVSSPTSGGRPQLVRGATDNGPGPTSCQGGGCQCPGGYLVMTSAGTTPICQKLSDTAGTRTWRILSNPPRPTR